MTWPASPSSTTPRCCPGSPPTCEIGSTPFLDTLAQLRAWLAANPDEVVTLFIEDHVDASLIASDIESTDGFEHTQETSVHLPGPRSVQLRTQPWPADAPLLLLNHWLARFTSLVTDAELVNASDVLLARAEQCQAERGQIPNFIAVNFVSIGDVHDVVDVLNGAS